MKTLLVLLLSASAYAADGQWCLVNDFTGHITTQCSSNKESCQSMQGTGYTCALVVERGE